jgi:hypothetical protein
MSATCRDLSLEFICRLSLDGHKRPVVPGSKFLPQCTPEGRVHGDKFEPFVGPTRPGTRRGDGASAIWMAALGQQVCSSR